MSWILAAEPTRSAEAELQQEPIEGMIGIDRLARAIRLDPERPDLRAAEFADAGEAFAQLLVDREVHGCASINPSGAFAVAIPRPASSRAPSTPPKQIPSTRASRIHFSIG